MLLDGQFGVRISELTIIFLFSKLSRPALASNQSPTHLTPGLLHGAKAAGA